MTFDNQRFEAKLDQRRDFALIRFFRDHSVLAAVAIWALVLLIAASEWFFELGISFRIFYLVPIGLVVVVFGGSAGLAVALLCASASILIENRHATLFSTPLLFWTELGARGAGFSLFVAMLTQLWRTYETELSRRLAAEEVTYLKSDLLALMNHEVGNATLILKHSVAGLEENAGVTEAQRHFCRSIERVAINLDEASQNFLSSAALESGHFVIRLERLQILGVVRQLRTRFSALLDEKKQTLEAEIGPGAGVVYADHPAFLMILVNLVGNAIKYTPSGGVVTIRCTCTNENRVRIAVEDTGVGIAQEDLERIRSGWYRSDAGRRMATGYGLGLKIVATFLAAHQSELVIESEVGKGSIFSFELPAKSDGPGQRPPFENIN